MTMPRVPLPLAPEEPRCSADTACCVTHLCARARAEVPRGTPMQDYSTQDKGGTVLCPGFTDWKTLRKQEWAKTDQTRKHPWPTL